MVLNSLNVPSPAQPEPSPAPAAAPAAKRVSMVAPLVAPISLGKEAPSEMADDALKSEGQLKKEKLKAASNECTEITPYMFVSGEDVAKDREALRTNGVTHIVNASNINLPNYFESDPSLDYLSLKLFDDKSQEISWFFLQVVAYIDACRRAGGK
ncbi:hypothetical protein TeGR_g2606, partial [Tetraparma gracilis]